MCKDSVCVCVCVCVCVYRDAIVLHVRKKDTWSWHQFLITSRHSIQLKGMNNTKCKRGGYKEMYRITQTKKWEWNKQWRKKTTRQSCIHIKLLYLCVHTHIYMCVCVCVCVNISWLEDGLEMWAERAAESLIWPITLGSISVSYHTGTLSLPSLTHTHTQTFQAVFNVWYLQPDSIRVHTEICLSHSTTPNIDQCPWSHSQVIIFHVHSSHLLNPSTEGVVPCLNVHDLRDLFVFVFLSLMRSA